MELFSSLKASVLRRRGIILGLGIKVSIDFKRPDNIFHPGETITGQLTLVQDEEGGVASIHGTPMIVLKGIEYCFTGLVGVKERSFRECEFFVETKTVGEANQFSRSEHGNMVWNFA